MYLYYIIFFFLHGVAATIALPSPKVAERGALAQLQPGRAKAFALSP